MPQIAGASCHTHQTTSYKATLREVSEKETLAVLWYSQGNTIVPLPTTLQMCGHMRDTFHMTRRSWCG